MQNLISKISTTALNLRCIVINEFKRNECRVYAEITGIYFHAKLGHLKTSHTKTDDQKCAETTWCNDGDEHDDDNDIHLLIIVIVIITQCIT